MMIPKYFLIIFTIRVTRAAISEQNKGVHINLIDENDPIVKYALEQQPEEFKIVEKATACSDTIDCSDVSKFDCFINPKKYLVLCRKTCKHLYKDDPHPPEIFAVSGGLEDVFIDALGFKINICSEYEGLDVYARDTYVTNQLNTDLTLSYVPKFTKDGFHKEKIPGYLYEDLMEHLKIRDNAENWVNETSPSPGVLNNQVVVKHQETGEKKTIMIGRTQILGISIEAGEKIFKVLGPLAEQWSGVKLRPTSLYGVRRYLNNSALLSHVDKSSTHVISLILNMRQDVDQPWPLFIRDHQGEDHEVYLKPGDMVWYESAACVHSRQLPLNGRFYDNIFVHFAPRGTGTWYE